MWKFIQILFFVCISCVSAAGASSEAIFKDAFLGHPKIYRPAQCGRNVYELAKLFERNDVQLSNAEVVFFLNEYRMVSGIPLKTTLIPSASRQGLKSWDFHVILTADSEVSENEKIVFDLDWKSQPHSITDYLASMFPDASGTRYNNIFIRRIPLGDYLEMLDGQEGLALLNAVGQLRQASDTRYPVETLREYLENSKN